jgi:hypothetical protein
MHQSEAVEDGGSLGKGILSSTEQGEEFVEGGTPAAGTQLKLGIQRVVAMFTGAAEVVGPLDGDWAKNGGDFGGTLALIAGDVTTGTGEFGSRLKRGSEGG